MFCRFCGKSLPDDSVFCQSCGKSTGTSSSAGTGASAAPALALSPTPDILEPNRNQTKVLLVALGVVLIILGALAFFLVTRSNSGINSARQPATLTPQTTPANSKPNAGQPRSEVTTPEVTTEELFKSASPSVVLVEVFDGSGQRSGTGSGFIAADGAVVTNYHVIRGAHSANLRLQDGRTMSIEGVIGFDQYRDIAVVRANNISEKPLSLGDSEKIQIGDKVIAIGSPLAIQNTMSDGLVSGLRNGLIQTSTPISPGSSGGPLFNSHGEVVGIAVAQVIGAQNINFAVPINWAKGYLHNTEVTSLSDLSRQNIVEQSLVGSTFSVPAHQRRTFSFFVDRNRMADPELEGSFSSSGGVGGEIRVLVVSPSGAIYDSGRTNSGTVHLPLAPGPYQLVIDNTGSAMFARSVTGDIKFRYVK